MIANKMIFTPSASTVSKTLKNSASFLNSINLQATYADAIKSCIKLGMSLLTPENVTQTQIMMTALAG